MQPSHLLIHLLALPILTATAQLGLLSVPKGITVNNAPETVSSTSCCSCTVRLSSLSHQPLTRPPPQFDKLPLGHLDVSRPAKGGGQAAWTSFEVSTPPGVGPVVPRDPIPHLQPISLPNYLLSTTGQGNMTIDNGGKGFFLGTWFGCGAPPDAPLPGFPMPCKMTITVTCTWKRLVGIEGAPRIDETITSGGTFEFVPGKTDSGGVGDGMMFANPSEAMLLSMEHQHAGTAGTFMCPDVSFVAVGTAGPVALYLDDAFFAS